MSSGMSKQEEELLDQKIARIRKKNEEILRRKLEIEEDKKFAEQNNAMVQLRPSTDDWPRERTPALRPSQRETQFDKGGGDADQMINEPLNRNKERNQPSARGRETSGKGAAPPPDPVSFLADPDRDYYGTDKEPPSFTRGNSRNFRDFKRGGPRRGRGSRGSGYHNHQGNHPSSNDDAWREERYRIDEARINRQKSADGKWRREWDNEKINLESQDDPISPSYTAPSGVSGRLDRWKQQPRNFESGDSYESPNSRGRGFGPGGGVGRGGRGNRGRGSYKVYPEHSPPGRSGQHGLNQNVNTSKYYSSSPPMPSKENYNFSTGSVGQQSASPNSNVVPSSNAQRLVTNIGDSFKIVVPNVSSEPVSRGKDTGRHMSRKGRLHQQNTSEIRGYRQRLSQSQSSYSEDECQNPDKEVFQKSKPNKQQISVPEKQKSQKDNKGFMPEADKDIDFSKSQKPPLPPFRTSLPKSKISVNISKELEDGELSWEDVTTSGTESIGDDNSSFTSSPRKVDSFTSESDCNFSYDSGNPSKDPTDIYTPEDFILLVPSEANYSENVANSSSLYLDCESVDESVSNTGTVSVESENIVKDAMDIYSPDDFIKLVPSSTITTKNDIDDNCSKHISSSNKEETLEQDHSVDNESHCQSKELAVMYKPEDFIQLVPSSEVVEDKSQDIKSVDSTNKNLVTENSQENLQSVCIPESVTVILKEDNTTLNESVSNHPESDEVKMNLNVKENSDEAESDKFKNNSDADNNLLKTETKIDTSNDIPKQMEIPCVNEDKIL